MIGDLKRKNHYVGIKLGEMNNDMLALKHTQLNFIYYRLGLEDLTDHIALDMPNILSLMGKFSQMIQPLLLTKPQGYVEAV